MTEPVEKRQEPRFVLMRSWHEIDTIYPEGSRPLGKDGFVAFVTVCGLEAPEDAQTGVSQWGEDGKTCENCLRIVRRRQMARARKK